MGSGDQGDNQIPRYSGPCPPSGQRPILSSDPWTFSDLGKFCQNRSIATVTPPAGFTVGSPAAVSISVPNGASASAPALVVNRGDLGEWGMRANLLVNNSEFALVTLSGVIGGVR